MNDPGLRQAIVEQLRQLHRTMWDARQDAWRVETATFFLWCANSPEITGPMWAPAAGSTWTGLQYSLRYPLQLLLIRLNRELELRHLIDVQIAVNAAKDEADLIRLIRAAAIPRPSGAWLAELADIPAFIIGSEGYPVVNNSLCKQQLTLEVLIADLTDSPLPVDVFSSTGAALKPIERHGQVIGWYSVGPDGNDDAGSATADFGIPLRAILGRPHFADEPEPRPNAMSSGPPMSRTSEDGR